MSLSKGKDLIGIGEFGKAIPPAAWKRIVETACSTFENLLAPVTETTGGLGRFIKAKFDKLTEPEQVVVATTYVDATEKADNSGVGRNSAPNPTILFKITENAECLVNPTLRELWSNLLARELTHGLVHPEIANVLGRLTAEDVVRFFEIAKSSKDENLKRLGVAVWTFLKLGEALGVTIQVKTERVNLQEFMLKKLGLIEWEHAAFSLTTFGKFFLRAVAPLTGENAEKVDS